MTASNLCCTICTLVALLYNAAKVSMQQSCVAYSVWNCIELICPFRTPLNLSCLSDNLSDVWEKGGEDIYNRVITYMLMLTLRIGYKPLSRSWRHGGKKTIAIDKTMAPIYSLCTCHWWLYSVYRLFTYNISGCIIVYHSLRRVNAVPVVSVHIWE